MDRLNDCAPTQPSSLRPRSVHNVSPSPLRLSVNVPAPPPVVSSTVENRAAVDDDVPVVPAVIVMLPSDTGARHVPGDLACWR